METISFKLEDSLAKEMEKAMKPLYTTKTEFIREAIREKIEEEEKKRALKALRENFGKGKGTARTNLSDEEIREKVFNEYAKKRGWKLE